MKEVHFVHTSDWHLGFFQYNRKERYFDFRNAVNNLIDQVIDLQPTFMLHTGDIFHHARPTPGTIRQAVRILKRLDREGIPTYLIRGNHDGMGSQLLQRGGGVISLLKDLELVTYIDDKIVEVDDNVIIAGVGYYTGQKINQKLDELFQLEEEFLRSDRFKIVAIHGFVEGQLEEFSQISLKHIGKMGVDYFAAGHYHIPWQHDKYRIYAPGSTEATSTNDWNRPDLIDNIGLYHSFYGVNSKHSSNWSVPQVEKHRYTVRPKVRLNLQSTHQSVTELKHELVEFSQQQLETIKKLEPSLSSLEPLLEITLNTNLPFEEYSQIKLEADEFPGYLHILSTITGDDWTLSTPESETSSVEHTIEQVLQQQFENFKGKQDDFVDLTLRLIEVLGKIPPSRPMVDDIYQSLLKAFENIDGEALQDIFKEIAEKESKLKTVEEIEEEVLESDEEAQEVEQEENLDTVQEEAGKGKKKRKKKKATKSDQIKQKSVMESFFDD